MMMKIGANTNVSRGDLQTITAINDGLALTHSMNNQTQKQNTKNRDRNIQTKRSKPFSLRVHCPWTPSQIAITNKH